ncbi:hypothetical protein Nepgr_009080 [Nepenthes gracilis]|uniref:Uncharacterized protein n=1 Tax=Nepenthes gracilis TaxID=150966 RepID=A0AAD3SA87_NEPGR|nr:hypothetical protein Nepgr_009080 [Nepenthes gracilis]
MPPSSFSFPFRRQASEETLEPFPIMASVADFSSDLRENDIKALCVEFNIPKEMAWRVPGADDRASYPPEGYFTVYEAHLRSGLRLPLPEELQSIMAALQIPIAQVHANAMRYICTLCIFSRKLDQKFRMSGLKVIFKVTQGPEWTSLSSRTGIKINTAIHDSLKNWKNRFFFVKVGDKWPIAEDRVRSWRYTQKPEKVEWGPPSTVKPHPPIKMMKPVIEEVAHPPRCLRRRLLERARWLPIFLLTSPDLVAAGICGGP